MDQITVDQLVNLAFAVEDGDPFDWGVFKEGREQTMKMIAASVLEQFQKTEYTQDDLIIMMASITKLVTENMILHTKLMRKNEV